MPTNVVLGDHNVTYVMSSLVLTLISLWQPCNHWLVVKGLHDSSRKSWYLYTIALNHTVYLTLHTS